jgi:hypothetical protein
VFVKSIGSNGEKIMRMNHKQFINAMTPISKKINEFIAKLGEGKQKLSAFSEWLDEYNTNDFASINFNF